MAGKDDTSPLTKRLILRVTEAEDAEIREQAEVAGMSQSEYARRRLTGRPITATTDAGTRAELARIGGLIKRFAVDAADRRLCNAALDELIAAARRIG